MGRPRSSGRVRVCNWKLCTLRRISRTRGSPSFIILACVQFGARLVTTSSQLSQLSQLSPAFPFSQLSQLSQLVRNPLHITDCAVCTGDQKINYHVDFESFTALK